VKNYIAQRMRPIPWVCPICYAVLGEGSMPREEAVDRLRKHQQVVHSQKGTDEKERELAVEQTVRGSIPKSSNPQLRPCPQCGVPVRADRVDRHLGKVHSGSKGTLVTPSRKHGKRENRPQEWFERRLLQGGLCSPR